MTPLPKKKHAKARTKTRKASIKLTLPQLVTCSKCNSLRLPHRACPNCGFYAKVKEEKTPVVVNEDQKRPQTSK